jgi:hypothetical protein
MGAELLRYDGMEEEEEVWHRSDLAAFRHVENVLQATRMVRTSSSPFAPLSAYFGLDWTGACWAGETLALVPPLLAPNASSVYHRIAFATE